MRISHARAHFLRVTAAAQAPAAAPATRADVSSYELMLATLAEHKRRLKDVQSMERKLEVKAELLPEYAPWIEGVMQGDSGRQDDVFMSCLVWKIDVGDLAGAADMAAYALRHGLTLPDQYARSLPALLAEEVADTALKAMTAGQEVDAELLRRVADMTADQDMHDPIRAKLHKALGYALRAAGRLDEAKAELERAMALHDKVGVKKDLEALARQIKNSAAAQEGGG